MLFFDDDDDDDDNVDSSRTSMCFGTLGLPLSGFVCMQLETLFSPLYTKIIYVEQVSGKTSECFTDQDFFCRTNKLENMHSTKEKCQ